MIKLELPKEERRTGKVRIKIGAKVRIKIGAAVGHDMHFFSWPGCKPPLSEFDVNEEYQYKTKHPNAIFTVQQDSIFKRAGEYSVIGPGYGQRGAYGNGALYVSEDDLEFIDERK